MLLVGHARPPSVASAGGASRLSLPRAVRGRCCPEEHPFRREVPLVKRVAVSAVLVSLLCLCSSPPRVRRRLRPRSDLRRHRHRVGAGREHRVVDAGGLALRRTAASWSPAGGRGASGPTVRSCSARASAPTAAAGRHVRDRRAGDDDPLRHRPAGRRQSIPTVRSAMLRVSGDILLSRFSATGDLDLAFGTGGSGDDGLRRVRRRELPVSLLQRRFSASPTATASSWSAWEVAPALCIVRYEANGALDASFGTAGIALVPAFLARRTWRSSLTARSCSPGRDEASMLPAVGTPPGRQAPWTSGSTADGLVTSDAVAGVFANQPLVGVAARPDGGVVATAFDFTLLRWKSNGKPDGTFGEKGVAALIRASGAPTADAAVDLALQPDWQVRRRGIGFVELGPPVNGIADTRSFSFVCGTTACSILRTASVACRSPASSRMNRLRVQPDGKAVAVGSKISTPLGTAWLIARTLAHSNGCPAAPVGGARPRRRPRARRSRFGTSDRHRRRTSCSGSGRATSPRSPEFGDPIGE